VGIESCCQRRAADFKSGFETLQQAADGYIVSLRIGPIILLVLPVTKLTFATRLMTLRSLTYLASDADGNIQVKTSQRSIGNLEVLVSGLCGTNVHDRTSGCGLGHEGVGTDDKIAGDANAVDVGQRVDLG